MAPRASIPPMDEDWSSYSKLFEAVLRHNGEQVAELVKEVGQVRLDVQSVKLNFEMMDRLFNGVGGTRPLDARLTAMELQMSDMQKQLADFLDEKKQREDADRRGSWQIRAALVTGFAALAVALINSANNLVQWFLRLNATMPR